MPVKIRLIEEAGGRVFSVPGHQAKQLVDKGLAVYLSGALKREAARKVEIADAPAPVIETRVEKSESPAPKKTPTKKAAKKKAPTKKVAKKGKAKK